MWGIYLLVNSLKKNYKPYPILTFSTVKFAGTILNEHSTKSMPKIFFKNEISFYTKANTEQTQTISALYSFL